MNITLKDVLSVAAPTVFTFLLWLGQRIYSRRGESDATYVDSRFDFTTKSEENLWKEIYALRGDLHTKSREYMELLLMHLELLADCGKPTAEAKRLLRDKLTAMEKEETEKIKEVKERAEEAKQRAAEFRKGELKNGKQRIRMERSVVESTT